MNAIRWPHADARARACMYYSHGFAYVRRRDGETSLGSVPNARNGVGTT